MIKNINIWHNVNKLYICCILKADNPKKFEYYPCKHSMYFLYSVMVVSFLLLTGIIFNSLLNTERMKFLEKDLEEIIFTADNNILERKGLLIQGKLKRQVRIGNYGIADLIAFYLDPQYPVGNRVIYKPTITVYELKQDNVSVSAFLQAIGYAKGIKEYFEHKKYKHLSEPRINITLIGKKIDTSSSMIYLSDIINSEHFNLEMYTYDYTISGLEFNIHENYALTNNGFK